MTPAPGTPDPSGGTPKLHMVWPERLLGAIPPARVPPGYAVRLLRPDDHADRATFLALMRATQLGTWSDERLARVCPTILPDGWFGIIHPDSGALVATAMAQDSADPLHPSGGEVGWVAADPAHRGRGLGRAVVALALARLAAVRYRRIYLKTDDHRLPAIRVYLDLGFEPLAYTDDMPQRWAAIRAQLAADLRPREPTRPR
jgi:mycothiol synthase